MKPKSITLPVIATGTMHVSVVGKAVQPIERISVNINLNDEGETE